MLILQLREGYDDEEHAKELIAKIEKRFESYNGRNIVLVIPPHVKLMKPIETDMNAVVEDCPSCGMKLRPLGQSELICNACGYTKSRFMHHMLDIQRQSGGGIRNL